MLESLPRLRDLRWSALLLVLNIGIQFYYSVEVCPYVEGQEVWLILLLLIGASGIIYTVKSIVHKSLFSVSNEQFLSRNNIFYDTLLFGLIGVLVGSFNIAFYDFPAVSGLKLATGNLAVGYLSANVLFFQRQISFMKSDLRISPEKLEENRVKVSRGLMVFVFITIILGLLVLVLLLVKDLRWLFGSDTVNFDQALKEVAFELVFVALVFLIFFVVIIVLFSRYLSYQISKQKATLSQVAQGNLNTEVGVYSKDEFGQIAHFTNHMIGQLRNNKDVIDSIEYAKRLQDAILPADDFWKSLEKELFIFFRPKDVVSGDFYWFSKVQVGQEEQLFFAVGDCTGHGVPGALVSIICTNALDRAVTEFGLTDPSEVLNKVRELVISRFSKSQEMIHDGMDIALCRIQGDDLVYAGANNPLWVVRKGELLEWKSDRQPVANYPNPKPFTSKKVHLEKDDTIYLFSDGFADQFGGPRGKKFGYRQFKSMLAELETVPNEERFRQVGKELDGWMLGYEQVDDICILGLKV